MWHTIGIHYSSQDPLGPHHGNFIDPRPVPSPWLTAARLNHPIPPRLRMAQLAVHDLGKELR